MSVLERTRLIKRTKSYVESKIEKNIPWREAAKKDIRNHSEGGQMLRASRFKSEITQAELANILNVSQHHISEMENGKRPIGKEMAKRLGEAFNVNYKLFL